LEKTLVVAEPVLMLTPLTGIVKTSQERKAPHDLYCHMEFAPKTGLQEV
jgi:hypothetical protein